MAFAGNQSRLIGICVAGAVAIGVTGYLAKRPSRAERALTNDPVRVIETTTNVAVLAKAVADPQPRIAMTALLTITRVSPEAARPLVQEKLKDQRAEVRAIAVTCAGHLTDRQNVGDLTKAVADPEPEVQVAAAKALGQLQAWDGLEPLTGLLNDKNILVRRSAISAIEHTLEVRFSDYKADADPAARLKAIEHIRAAIPKLKNAHQNFIRRQQKGRQP